MNTVFSKVLFIGPVNEFGGIGAVLDSYRKNIPGFKFIPTFSSGSKRFKTVFFLKSLYRIVGRLLRDKEIRIVHVHSASNGSFIRKSIVSLIGKMFGKRIIFHIHSGGFKDYYYASWLRAMYIRFVLRISNCVICLSGEWLEFFSDHLKLRNVIIVGNPISISDCAAAKDRTDVLNLLFLGKICDDKGIFDLLNFLRTNHDFLSGKINLVIGGNGEDKRLISMLSDPVFHNRVRYEGWVQGSKKHDLICACDTFILPSYMEGLPVSILEAMGCSKPVIATKVGGIPSIIKEGYNGWLIDSGSFYKLDEIFERIFVNPGILRKFGINAKTEAGRFSEDAIFHRLAELYTAVVDKKMHFYLPHESSFKRI